MVDINKHLESYPSSTLINKVRILKHSGKNRTIYSPSPELKKWLKTLLKLLMVRKPAFKNYVHSIQGKSCITFAQSHLGSSYLLVMDITNYFPSIGEEFAKKLLIPLLHDNDLVNKVLERCYYDDCLPQGFATSTFIANLASESIFATLFQEFEKQNLATGVYVDDIAISSGQSFDHEAVERKIKDKLARYGMTVNAKTIFYDRNDTKYLTGLQLENESNRIILSNEAWEMLYAGIKSGKITRVQTEGWFSYLSSFDKVKARKLKRLILRYRHELSF